MAVNLKNIVKSLKPAYRIYYILGSCFLRILGVFVKMNEKQILFVVYGGQRYDDSPRFIYEYMISHGQYRDYKCVWAFTNPDKENLVAGKKVKIDTISYFVEALRSKYWITNSSASRGLNFMKKKTINIYTQHGMAGIKKIGNDIGAKNVSFKNGFHEKFDRIVIEGNLEEDILAGAWEVDRSVFLNIGLPRNDELVHRTESDVLLLKKKLGVPLGKKVILYAPTFREYNKDSKFVSYLKPPFHFDRWMAELGNEYVLLLTAHYEVAELMDVPEKHPFVINQFQYPYINDLLLVSDLLISDYSSIIFDFSILERPILAYAYDYDVYKKERGVYDGYEEIFSHGIMKTEEEVIRFIKNMDYAEECLYTKENIKQKYISNCGGAAEKFVKEIFG